MVLKIWGFKDKSEKIEIYLSVSQRAYLAMKWFFSPFKSVPIGDLAQILCVRRKRCLGQDLFPSQSSPLSCQNGDLFPCVVGRECHM